MDEVRDALDWYADNAPDAFGAAIYERALGVEAQAIRNCPVDTGRLRSSAFVAAPEERSSGKVAVLIGFGTDYAVEVHETAKDYTTGGYKYLRRAMDSKKSQIAEQIAKAAHHFMEQGTGIAILDKTGIPEKPNPDGNDFSSGPPGSL